MSGQQIIIYTPHTNIQVPKIRNSEPEENELRLPAAKVLCKCSPLVHIYALYLGSLKVKLEYQEGMDLLYDLQDKLQHLCFPHIRILASQAFGLFNSAGGISKTLLTARLKLMCCVLTGKYLLTIL